MEPTQPEPQPPAQLPPPPGPSRDLPLTPRPSVLGRRVAAGFIDLAPLVMISAGFAQPDDGEGWQFRLAGLGLLAFGIVALAYYFVCEAVTGTTPGKRLVGLTVIDEHGGRPSVGTVAKRTLLRPVDAFPFAYLVGFIAVAASTDNQRLGDMVARTRVVSLAEAQVEANDFGGAPPRSRPVFLAVVAVLAIAGGIVGVVSLVGQTAPGDRLGSFEIERDMKPRIAEIMGAFEDPDPEAINALFVDGVSTVAQIDDLLGKIDAAFGPYQGSYEVVDHRKVIGANVNELDGTFNLMQFQLDAEFENGQQTVIITFADVDGQLEMLAWNVAR